MEAAVADDLTPHDLVRLGRVLHVVSVLVADEGGLATEHGLVELERRAGVAAKVQVGRGADGHGWLLASVVG
ncbi:MAG: hypothetical protein WKF47_12990 [Geodermatophilaceae bacterium]